MRPRAVPGSSSSPRDKPRSTSPTKVIVQSCLTVLAFQSVEAVLAQSSVLLYRLGRSPFRRRLRRLGRRRVVSLGTCDGGGFSLCQRGLGWRFGRNLLPRLDRSFSRG